jgi:hypothetical protein
MLMKVKRQDWDAQFGYAPPRVDAVLNTEDVVSAVPCESRGQGPWMRVTFRSGAEWIVWGTPDDLTRGFVVVWVVERFCGIRFSSDFCLEIVPSQAVEGQIHASRLIGKLRNRQQKILRLDFSMTSILGLVFSSKANLAKFRRKRQTCALVAALPRVSRE